MNQESLRAWLLNYFSPEQWGRGVSRDDLVNAAGEDENLVRLFRDNITNRLYRNPAEVLDALERPRQADGGRVAG
jgi:hypothetical protein